MVHANYREKQNNYAVQLRTITCSMFTALQAGLSLIQQAKPSGQHVNDSILSLQASHACSTGRHAATHLDTLILLPNCISKQDGLTRKSMLPFPSFLNNPNQGSLKTRPASLRCVLSRCRTCPAHRGPPSGAAATPSAPSRGPGTPANP